MADVFISYKSERRAAAAHLAEVLRLHGYSVWFDYGLLSGRDFGRQIEKELRAAKACVVLWCSMSIDSEWVLDEARLAKDLDRYTPCWLEKVGLPLGYGRDDTIDLTPWDGAPRSSILDRLLGEIARRVNRQPRPNFEGLRQYEETWRRFGAPSLAKFALGEEAEARLGGNLSLSSSKPRSSLSEGATPPGHRQPQRKNKPQIGLSRPQRGISAVNPNLRAARTSAPDQGTRNAVGIVVAKLALFVFKCAMVSLFQPLALLAMNRLTLFSIWAIAFGSVYFAFFNLYNTGGVPTEFDSPGSGAVALAYTACFVLMPMLFVIANWIPISFRNSWVAWWQSRRGFRSIPLAENSERLEALKFDALPGTAQIYLYRMLPGSAWDISVDDNLIGQVQGREFIRVECAPGQHMLHVSLARRGMRQSRFSKTIQVMLADRDTKAFEIRLNPWRLSLFKELVLKEVSLADVKFKLRPMRMRLLEAQLKMSLEK